MPKPTTSYEIQHRMRDEKEWWRSSSRFATYSEAYLYASQRHNTTPRHVWAVVPTHEPVTAVMIDGTLRLLVVENAGEKSKAVMDEFIHLEEERKDVEALENALTWLAESVGDYSWVVINEL